LLKEVKDFCKEKADGVSAFPDPAKGILFWRAKVVGAAVGQISKRIRSVLAFLVTSLG
jgi:hypothetical protein